MKPYFYKSFFVFIGLFFTINLIAQDTTMHLDVRPKLMEIGKKVNGKYVGEVRTYEKYEFDSCYKLLFKTIYKDSIEKTATTYWTSEPCGVEVIRGIAEFKHDTVRYKEMLDGKIYSYGSFIENKYHFGARVNYGDSGEIIDSTFYENYGKNYIKYSYDGGKLNSIESVIDEKKNGTQVKFYKDGKFEYIKKFLMDVQVGTWYAWYENGQMAWSQDYGYTDKDIYLKSQAYRPIPDPDEPPFEHCDQSFSFCYKLENGKSSEWFQNGQLQREGYYANGKKTGQWIEYYENGHLKSKGSYTKDTKRVICDYPFNDRIEKHFPYLDKEDFYNQYIIQFKDGVWEYYHENGTLEKVLIYKKGVKNGLCKYFDEQGKLILEKTYKNGIITKEEKK